MKTAHIPNIDYEKALELNPNDAKLHRKYANYLLEEKYEDVVFLGWNSYLTELILKKLYT